MFETAVLVDDGQPLPGMEGVCSRLLGTTALRAGSLSHAKGRRRSGGSLSARVIRAAQSSHPDLLIVPAPMSELPKVLEQVSQVVASTRTPVLVVTKPGLERLVVHGEPGGMLEHVVVLADFAFRASCAHACAIRLVQQGARHVTLRHAHGMRPHVPDKRGAIGELEWIDFVGVEALKSRLLRAGAQAVEFELPPTGEPGIPSGATLLVLSAHCDEHVREVVSELVSLRAREESPCPGILLPPGPCCVE